MKYKTYATTDENRQTRKQARKQTFLHNASFSSRRAKRERQEARRKVLEERLAHWQELKDAREKVV